MIVLIIGLMLVLIGIMIMLSKTNMLRIIIGFSIVDTGIHLIIVALGYIKNATAPIIDLGVKTSRDATGLIRVLDKVADPVPSALVLTSIVIGLAVTALMLSYAIRLYQKSGTLNIDDHEESKW